MVNNSININKTKEGLISDGQQFHFFCFVDIRGVVDHH
jgi:hypothetical protein